MNRQAARNWTFDLLASLFDLKEVPRTLDYVRGLTLPPEVSPTHSGDFNPDVQPLATLVYDWFDDPKWRELDIVKGSQGGLSQAAQNCMCKIAEHKLGDTMMLLESGLKSKDLGNERVKAMFKANLGAHIGDERDQLQNRVLKINGIRFHLAGARTAGGVASRTLRFGFGDEVDEWLTELQGGESNALDLFLERFKLVADAKIMFFSKPRNADADEDTDDAKKKKKQKDDGIIWKRYLGGSRHKCCIPCPHCWCDPFELVWRHEGHRYQMAHCAQVRFDHCRRSDGISWDFDRMREETHFVCPACKRPIYDEQKVEQVLKHRIWIPTNDNTDSDVAIPGRMSAHMSDLYCNSREFPTLTIGQLAINCVSSKTKSARRAFRRGTLGLPIDRNAVAKMETEPMRRLCGKFPRGTCPVDPVFACVQVDVQEHGNLFKWTTQAYTMDDECFIMDYGSTEIGEEIAAILERPVPVVGPDGQPVVEEMDGKPVAKQFFIPGGWVDEGDGVCLKQVLDLCLHKPLFRRLSTCKGRGGMQTLNMTDRVVLQQSHTHQGLPLDRYLIDDHHFKDDLYEERIAPWSEYLRKHQRGEDCVPPSTPRIHFFAGAPDELLEEFCTEKKGEHVRNGKLVFGWPPKPEGGMNDYSDTVKDGLAMWYRVKLKIQKQIAKDAKAAADRAAANHGALTTPAPSNG